MSAHRLFVLHDLIPGERIRIDGERAHYIGKVLRCRPGEQLQLFNGDGDEFTARIESISKSAVECSVGERLQRDVESPLRVRLIQGVSRGDRMDTVVQKATELGVRRLSPLLAEFSVVRLDAERSDKKQRHWAAISQSACEQCGRNRPPQIDLPCRFDEVLRETPAAGTARLILLPTATESLASLDIAPRDVELLIGPEGGFSRTEQERALAAGFRPVALGPRVLRTETAAISVLTLVQAMWGDLA
jgi:16S rRNA (uracil1498-N3)-methyltransferase